MLQNRAGMLGLSFEVAGVAQVSRVLAISAERVTDLIPAFEKIADDFTKGEKKVFIKEGAVGEATSESGVGTWVKFIDLNPEYAALKLKKGFGSKILVRTGKLKGSLTDSSGEGHIRVINKLNLEIGTSVPYAGYHQTGTKNKDGSLRMPKREPLRITKKQARFWVSIINKFLLDVGERERSNL